MSTAIIARPSEVGDVRQFSDVPDDCFHRCTWEGRDPFTAALWQAPNGSWVLRRTHPDCTRHQEGP